MRKWKTNSGDSVEKFATRGLCVCSCGCNNYTCRPTPTHDVGEQSQLQHNRTSGTSVYASEA